MLSACREQRPRDVSRIPSKGLPSELLLVVDDAIWKSDVADTLRHLTQGPVPGLMQHEPYFRVVRITDRHYVQRYVTMHSKLFVHLDAAVNGCVMGVSHNVSATPQIEVTIKAASLEQLRLFLSTRKQEVRDLINESQLQMRMASLRRRTNAAINRKIRQTMGLNGCVPPTVIASKTGKDFFWAGANANEKDLNIVLYTYPWNGEDIAQSDAFVYHRDSVMQVNIPGSQPDQWVRTTRVDGMPIMEGRSRTLDGQQVYEVRGLWEMVRGALGGPFVSLSTVDSVRHRVVVAEGFVYSPSTDKRELIRTVEASVRTFECSLDEKTKDEIQYKKSK